MATITDTAYPPGALIGPADVHVNHDTTFLVRTGPAMSELYFARRDGGIERRIGSSGQGPGEFTWPTAQMETSSEYLVFDSRLSRLTRLSKPDLTVNGMVQIPLLRSGDLLGIHPVALSDGQFVVNADIRAGGADGQPLHIFGPDGRLLRSFGGEGKSGVESYLAGLAVSGDSAVWIADLNRYRIRRFDLNGKLVRVLERKPDWFPWPPPEPKSGQSFAQLHGLWEDGHGRLWVYIAVRRRRITESVIEQGGQVRRAPVIRLDPNPAHAESIVEVLDAETGKLLASMRTPGVRGNLTSGGFFEVVRRESANGELLLDVWSYRLR